MRTFLELLPYRIRHTFGWRSLRAVLVARKRRRSASTAHVQHVGRRRLFVDVAVISDNDAGTGIQRVVRALALGMLREAPEQWQISFVSARRKRPYFEIDWPKPEQDIVAGEQMCAKPGDVFLGLDYSLDAVRRHKKQLTNFRQSGGALWFLVHDMLPIENPAWFSRNTVIRYRAWLGVLASLADGFFCNSRHTEKALQNVLFRVYGLEGDYRTQVLPMGHTIVDPSDSSCAADLSPRFDTSKPFVLMVGTLEPRKGHDDVIAAFEDLWQCGRTEKLVLVGRRGWKVDALCDLVQRHVEYGKRLLWFDDVSDSELAIIYETCSGVIVASRGEGFGLPLIEAMGFGKPILARNLPVFRVHEGKGVHFFPADASRQSLVDSMEKWLDAVSRDEILVTSPNTDWRASVTSLLSAINAPNSCNLDAS